jgi:outer membrane murein-binding lipoprotein Lpp
VVDDLDTAVTNLTTKVTALENAKPNLEGYVTTAQFEAALGAYITDLDNLVGGGL